MRLAIVASHPIQYYAPWFRHIAAQDGLQVRVFYLWNFGVEAQRDRGFAQAVQWDVPLLEGYEHEFVPNTSDDPGTHHFGGLRNPELHSRLKKWNPDAVLLTVYNYQTIAKLLLSRKIAPLIFRGDSHRLNERNENAKEQLRRAAIRLIFARFDACLCVGRANREYFRRHGVPTERLFFAPHSVDNDRFIEARESAAADAKAWRKELSIPEEKTVILYAGKFAEHKGVRDLVRAYRGVPDDNTRLLLVGSGPLEEWVHSEAAGDQRIVIAPFQNQTAMPRTYAAGDLFVLPSRSESWGLSVNEAMVMQRPALVSDICGCRPDLIRPVKTGDFFPAGHTEELKQKLTELTADSAALRRMGRTAARLVTSRYNYDRATAGLLKALHACARR